MPTAPARPSLQRLTLEDFASSADSGLELVYWLGRMSHVEPYLDRSEAIIIEGHSVVLLTFQASVPPGPGPAGSGQHGASCTACLASAGCLSQHAVMHLPGRTGPKKPLILTLCSYLPARGVHLPRPA